MSAAERRSYFDAYIDEVVSPLFRHVCSPGTWSTSRSGPDTRLPAAFVWVRGTTRSVTDYIRRAFERAAKVDGKTKLVLNEAQTERDDELGLAVRRGLLQLVGDLKNAGVKLDVVGLQGHLQPQYPHDPARFSDFLHSLAALGVDIYITEFDVCDDIFPKTSRRATRPSPERRRQFLDTTLSHPAVKAVITWELADKYTFYKASSSKRTRDRRGFRGRCPMTSKCSASRCGMRSPKVSKRRGGPSPHQRPGAVGLGRYRSRLDRQTCGSASLRAGMLYRADDTRRLARQQQRDQHDELRELDVLR